MISSVVNNMVTSPLVFSYLKSVHDMLKTIFDDFSGTGKQVVGLCQYIISDI